MRKVVKFKKKKAIKKLIVEKKIAIAVLVVISVVITSYFFALKSPFFNIKTISVTGNDKLTKDKVTLYSGIAVGDNLVKLDKGETVLNLKSEPYIKSVEVQKNLPSGVVLKIEEKKDILVLEGDKKIYLDLNGEILSKENEFKSYTVPVVEGIQVKSSIISKSLDYKNDIDKNEFLDFIRGVDSLDSYSELRKVEISDKGSLSLYFGRDQIVKLGDFSDMQYKFNYLNEIFKDMDKKEKVFETIDFTRGSRVIVEEKLVGEEE